MSDPATSTACEGVLTAFRSGAAQCGADGQVFDPLAGEFMRDPYPTYDRMRVEHPVYFLPPRREGEQGAWYVFRHADVTTVLRDARFGREAPMRRDGVQGCPMAVRPYFEMKHRWMLFRDPPYHTRVRSVALSALTPSLVDAFVPRIEQIANELIDAVEPSGAMDVVSDYAFPLAIRVIAELLGVPRDDLQRFIKFSGTLVAAVDLRQSSSSHERAAHMAAVLTELVQPLIAHRAREPGPDLVSALLQARAGGGEISDDELLAMVALLLLSGHETSVKLIANTVWALFEHPSIWASTRADPACLHGVVDELIRYAGPVHFTDRLALEDVELRGHTIRRGQQVWAVIGSANRDPAVFTDADRLVPNRRHVAHRGFGLGIHYCVGAYLGRAELVTALRVLFQRCGDLAPFVERITWHDSAVLRGIKTLPVAL